MNKQIEEKESGSIIDLLNSLENFIEFLEDTTKKLQERRKKIEYLRIWS